MLTNQEIYRRYLSELNMESEAEDDVIEFLTRICQNFIDSAYNVHPVQQAQAEKRIDTQVSVTEQN